MAVWRINQRWISKYSLYVHTFGFCTDGEVTSTILIILLGNCVLLPLRVKAIPLQPHQY